MLLLVYATVGTAIVLYGLLIDDRIERSVCAREGRRYSPLWIFNLPFRFNVLRIADARDAGLLAQRIGAMAAFVVYAVAGFIIRPWAITP